MILLVVCVGISKTDSLRINFNTKSVYALAFSIIRCTIYVISCITRRVLEKNGRLTVILQES